MPLFAARGFELILAKLMFAQAVQGFAPPPGSTEVSLLFVAKLLRAHEFSLQFSAAMRKPQVRGAFKFHFCAGFAGFQLARLLGAILFLQSVQLFNHVAHAGDLLVGRAQAQLLLMLKALIQMEHGLE